MHERHERVEIKVFTYRKVLKPTPNTDYQSAQWEFESSKTIDHANSSDRKWLGNHCFWAMRNGRKVSTFPNGLSDDEMIRLGRNI